MEHAKEESESVCGNQIDEKIDDRVAIGRTS
jgi:hypothetical protein